MITTQQARTIAIVSASRNLSAEDFKSAFRTVSAMELDTEAMQLELIKLLDLMKY